MSNQTTKKNYSYVALIVALVAFIAALFLGIVRGLIACRSLPLPMLTSSTRPLLSALAIAILAIATYAIMEPERVRRFLTGRQARYGSNALIMTIALLFILGLINVLFTNPKFGLNQAHDLTENKTNTLAPETLSALKALPEKVTATAFFRRQRPDQRHRTVEQHQKQQQRQI